MFLSSIYNKHRDLIFFSLLFLVIIILCGSIPFFWTMGYVGTYANRIYESGFTTLIFPDFDTGNIPLYYVYLASLWFVFGKSLLVAHLAVFPFMVGILYEIKRISKSLDANINIIMLFALLLFEPTFITVSILGSYDVCIAYFTLLAIRCLLTKNKRLLYLPLLILPLLDFRGFTIVFALYLTDLYINFSNSNKFSFYLKSLIPYIISALVLGIWLLYHYLHSGWFLIGNSCIGFHHINSPEMFLRNFIYIIWKIFDFGRFIIWIPVIAAFIYYLIIKKKNKLFTKAVIIMLLSTTSYMIFLYPMPYPVSHRYFLIAFILANIPFIMLLNLIKKKTIKILILSATCLILLSGNFILYPERFGNGWDASLKVIPYFKLEKDFIDFVKVNKINSSDIGAQYPMNFDTYDTRLTKDHFQFTDIDAKPFNKFKYVAQSNICNNFALSQVEELNKSWVLIKEMKSWQVYIKLYKNPGIQ